MNAPESVNGLFTPFGDRQEEVDVLLDTIQASEHSAELLELQERFGRARDAQGNVVRGFVLEYDPADMVCPTLLESGFVHSAPVRIEDGEEEWQVCSTGDREDIEDSLEEVREKAGRKSPSPPSRAPRAGLRGASASNASTSARRRNGRCSARDLAGNLDLSKTTLIDRLRKTESKLLDL